jgi:uncharacterized membrane protein
MFPSGIVQWHAALNDFPAILFLVSIGLDLAGSVTGRDSLKAAGFWTLVVGAAGAVLALITGLLAEEIAEHGGAMHEIMERHETMAKIVTVYFVGLAGWRIWRKGSLGPQERPTYLVMASVGAVFTLWTAHLGGKIVYEHGAGITTEVMEQALRDRAAGHEHAEGEEHEHDTTPTDSAAPGAADTGHVHPPGTPEHEHE